MAIESETPEDGRDKPAGTVGGSAASLGPQVYDELRRLAAAALRRERVSHTLQPTALVHEAFLRLADQHNANYQSRAHFLSMASEVIRRVLVDHARQHLAQKRGGGRVRVTMSGVEAQPGSSENEIDVIGLDAAMKKLEQLDPRQARVVQMRFFGGMSVEETASMLNVSNRTVESDWRMARAWLRQELAATDERG